ncbi:MAG TPA: hypothetical protein VJR92_07630 [Gemmatimonadaceae bacterium]|nr:hypothetical protein [Gemmatimonadaceae bacterium]
MIATRFLTALACVAFATTIAAQRTDTTGGSADTAKSRRRTAAVELNTQPSFTIQHLRPVDKRGLNMFESPKQDTVTYTGFKLSFGAAFTQQFQGIDHENTAAPRIVNNVDANQLIKIGNGFNNAVANFYLNAQLAPGIRVAMTSYLSARHHQETWVKDGFLLIDESPIDAAPLHKLMEYMTLKIGHFEINYGDAHFRRTDNGNAMFNPFVGNYIMDAFTTEIGAEAYVRTGPWLAMAAATGGEIRGQVTAPEKRGPSYIGKLGFDKQLTETFRARLTTSGYVAAKSSSNTLYTGDRAGSRYYMALENTTATEKDQAWSGAIRPGLSAEARALVVNPFIKLGGFEYFGNIEWARGRALADSGVKRSWTQHVGELLYRFGNDKAYVGARFNSAAGVLTGIPTEVSAQRTQLGGGWFLTPSVLLKAEWMTQKYLDFPTTDIRNGGRIRGFMLEGVVAF